MTEAKKYTLPREFGEKWVSALRSGAYLQGQCTLLRNKHYCCLGVAGAVAGIPKDKLEGSGYLRSWHKELSETLPEALLYYHDQETGKYEKPWERTEFYLSDTVSKLNDTEGKNFLEIADWIEANVEFI